MASLFEVVSYGLHYYVKQDWAKYRPLMHPNLDLKTFTLFTIPFDRCSNPSYKLLITFTIHSSTPTCLRAYHKPRAALYRRPSPSLQILKPSTTPSDIFNQSSIQY